MFSVVQSSNLASGGIFHTVNGASYMIQVNPFEEQLYVRAEPHWHKVHHDWQEDSTSVVVVVFPFS